jgi:hypothetical protein
MVALTENDVIPDIKNITNEGAWWLYFCPWYGDFIMSSTNNDPVLLKTIYNSPSVITLDELPANLYSLTQTAVSLNKGYAALKQQKSRTLLMINNNISKHLTGMEEIYSLSGRKVDLQNTVPILRNGIIIKKQH